MAKTRAPRPRLPPLLERNPAMPENPALARHFGIGEVEKLTGVPIRTLQNWTNLAVLAANEETQHAGHGIHRSFVAVEVQIAALLQPLHAAGLPRTILARCADFFRQALMWPEDAPAFPGARIPEPERRQLARVLIRAARSRGSNW